MSTAPERVEQLVERFDRHIEEYRTGRYNETMVRREYIDPLFTALGWDVANRAGYAEAYKDVIHEDAIKVGAPDYCFRIGGTRKFFLEAKKPSVDIAGEIAPAYQLRRYAWSAKLPLSILTDFEEFAVYDCRVRPRPTDKAAVARTMYLTYTQYTDHWDEIAAVFSKDAVLQGSFDKYVVSRKKRGTAEVDAEFLTEIETWRSALARNLALRNSAISNRELNFAVQRTIDRIIFLRICEDRGAEPTGQLQSLINGTDVYRRLLQIFRAADDRYNSGLFHFNREPGRPDPDELTPNLAVDDKVLGDMFRSLYYPASPYEFSVLPPDILGSVYEQFLGKVIHLTRAHRARVEEKPEVKKAGGIYYTPKYIVDYIVAHTVGKLIEGKTPRGISWLRILDPACGSGSFLIGAYRKLLDYHRDWYLGHNPSKYTNKLYQGAGGQWFLTTAEKKRILLNNIYGVDIDAQAIEVTKLNLLLCTLEGENQQTLDQLALIHERALPDLACNVKCGNSLMGPDFYEGKQLSLFDEDTRYRINAFDWEAEFSEIFKRTKPGFDAVIGNPPWLMPAYYHKDTLSYLRSQFESAKGKFDLYYVFIEQGLRLLRSSGGLGMIVPNKFFHTAAAAPLREILRRAVFIRNILDFGHEQVFRGATNYSCILILDRRRGAKPIYSRVTPGLGIVEEFPVPSNVFSKELWHFVRKETRSLFDKMEQASMPLGQLVSRFGSGVQTGADRIMIVDTKTVRMGRFEKELLRRVLKGRDIRRYSVSTELRLLIFPYFVERKAFVIVSEAKFKSCPNVYAHLSQHKRDLAHRVWFGKNATDLSGEWYGLMYLDSYKSFRAPHILSPSLSNRANFCLGTGDLFMTGTAGVTSVIPKPEVSEDISYFLGTLNSSLLSFYATKHSPVFSGRYYKFTGPYLKNLPIRRIDFSHNADKAAHDLMVKLVQNMLGSQQQLRDRRTAHEKELIHRQIEATDRQIDKLVYELYGLTDEEIKIVEQATR